VTAPRATVREVDGQLVLDDPDALAMARAVAKYNCHALYEVDHERVQHFVRRIAERGLAPAEVCIVLINVDDVHGSAIADVLMPGHDWQAYRDRGMTPIARGLAGREGICLALSAFDDEAARKASADLDKVIVVVVDHGVAEVFVP
jgi:hypothetical protein